MDRYKEPMLSTWICILLLGIINFLFAYKYFSRFTSLGLSVAIASTLLVQGLIIALARIRSFYFDRRLFYLVVTFLVGASIVSLWAIDFRAVAVDRWAMITLFLDNLFDGKHPYTPLANSSIPGPFPVCFVYSLPAYFAGDIGYLNTGAICLFAIVIRQIMSGESFRKEVLLLIHFALSVAIWWEIAVRSTLFGNMVIVAAFLLFLEKFEYDDIPLVSGTLGGLVLATRSVVILPLLIYFAFKFRHNPLSRLRYIASGLICFLIFCATLLPLYLWRPEEFMLYNPLLVQSIFLPTWAVIVLVACSVAVGSTASSLTDCFWWAGVLLFSAVGGSFLITAAHFGYRQAFWGSKFDISYFILAMPFLLLALYNDWPTEEGQP